MVAQAVAAVDALDTDLLVLGEIGIGNTTAAAALAGALLGGDAATWVGRGTGVDDAGLERKRAAVAAVMERTSNIGDPIEIMREAGGAELTAIAAATVAARLRSIPVVLDGYVVTSAVLPLHVAAPGALDHCIVGHCSAEPGHRRVLEAIAKPVLLDLGMRLGEGSGAMVAVPIVRAACDAVVEVATFTEWFGQGQGERVPRRSPVPDANSGSHPDRGPPRPRRCRGSRSSEPLIGALVGGVAAGLGRARADCGGGGGGRRPSGCWSPGHSTRTGWPTSPTRSAAGPPASAGSRS